MLELMVNINNNALRVKGMRDVNLLEYHTSISQMKLDLIF